MVFVKGNSVLIVFLDPTTFHLRNCPREKKDNPKTKIYSSSGVAKILQHENSTVAYVSQEARKWSESIGAWKENCMFSSLGNLGLRLAQPSTWLSLLFLGFPAIEYALQDLCFIRAPQFSF